MDNETNWIDALSVGSPVLIHTYLNPLVIRHVTKFTPTQVVVGDSRFRRDTGKLIGESGSWRTTFLIEPNEENLNKYQHQKAVNALRRVEWSRLTAEDAIRAWGFIEGMMVKS